MQAARASGSRSCRPSSRRSARRAARRRRVAEELALKANEKAVGALALEISKDKGSVMKGVDAFQSEVSGRLDKAETKVERQDEQLKELRKLVDTKCERTAITKCDKRIDACATAAMLDQTRGELLQRAEDEKAAAARATAAEEAAAALAARVGAAEEVLPTLQPPPPPPRRWRRSRRRTRRSERRRRRSGFGERAARRAQRLDGRAVHAGARGGRRARGAPRPPRRPRRDEGGPRGDADELRRRAGAAG